jgi:glycosyltransferase involved in cell wall biosynthesis
MATQPRVLLVNPADVLRPEIRYLVSALGETVEFHVLLTEECDPSPLESAGVGYDYFPARYVPGIRYTVPMPGFVRTLSDRIADSDVVHVIDYDYLPCAVAVLLAARSDAATVVTTDALPGVSWSYGARLVDAFAWTYTQTLGRAVFEAADRVVGLGEYLHADLAAFTDESKVETIPNGIDTERFVPGEDEADEPPTSLLYVGRIDEVKNVTLLIEAMALLADRGDESYELTVVGDGDQRDECEKLAVERGVADRIEFVGWQSDVVPYYQRHDVFVLPSVAEGLSNVLMEAQACGLPVVTTDVGGAREVVGAGAVVRPGDASALAEGIERVADLRSPELARTARNHVVDAYSLQAMGEGYAALYEELLGG